jgi:hypothetical protein
MARQHRNRVSAVLAAFLAVMLVGGIAVEFAAWNNSLPEGQKWLVLLPGSRWGFGQRLIASHSPERQEPNPFRIGFFGVRVK